MCCSNHVMVDRHSRMKFIVNIFLCVSCLHAVHSSQISYLSSCNDASDGHCKCNLLNNFRSVDCKLKGVDGVHDTSHVQVTFYPEKTLLEIYCFRGRFNFDEFYQQNVSTTAATVNSFVLVNCPLPKNLTYLLENLKVKKISERLKILAISSKNDVVNAEFFRGVDVKRLSLSHVDIVDLSENALSSMSSLENLYIGGAATLNMPANAFSRNTRLKVLNVLTCGLESISEGLLNDLELLSSVSFKGNQLAVLSEDLFSNLTSLKFIYLGHNKLRTLPGSVFRDLVNLEELRLDSNDFTYLPENLFTNSSKLKFIKLGPSKIRAMASISPLLFTGLTSLKTLHLEGLGLQSLPSGIFADMPNLEKLVFDSNNISYLDSSIFSDLSQTIYLSMNNNPLSFLEPGLLRGLRSLEQLHANNLSLRGIPEGLFSDNKKLSIINMAGNAITTLRQYTFIGVKLSLEQLDLSHNSIEGENWHNAFDSLNRLRKLDLAYNRISSVPLSLQLLRNLKALDLKGNRIHYISSTDLNFQCEGAVIDLSYNQIDFVSLNSVDFISKSDSKSTPNSFLMAGNPLQCDCRAFQLRSFLLSEGEFDAVNASSLHNFLSISFDKPVCASPIHFRGNVLTELAADDLLCSLDSCPAGCTCQTQISRGRVLVTCTAHEDTYALTSFPFNPVFIGDLTFHINLKHIELEHIANFGDFNYTVSSLDLSHNNLRSIDSVDLPKQLLNLQLDHNDFNYISDEFIDYVSNRASSNPLTLSLGNNPYKCNCSLLPLMRFIKLYVPSDKLQIVDVNEIRCGGHDLVVLDLSEEDVCPSGVIILIGVCASVALVAFILLLMAVAYYQYGDTIKVWLYSHQLCLSWITEKEMDADKQYDAFISYSHLDEEFVVDELVPKLENGNPSYSLCLHFRDWTAGEWITDQIERSVRNSRRVIVVVSQNFVDSDWGRLEFVAAHRQSLRDKTNRLIVVVYGQLPNVSRLDAELRLYLTMNTYLQWGDPLFWQRLRYALPHYRIEDGRYKLKKNGKKTFQTHSSLDLSIYDRNSAADSGISSNSTELSGSISTDSNSGDGSTNDAYVPDIHTSTENFTHSHHFTSCD